MRKDERVGGCPLFSSRGWGARHAQRVNPKPLNFRPLKVGKVNPPKKKVLKPYKIAKNAARDARRAARLTHV
jgi:hypothetical protein